MIAAQLLNSEASLNNFFVLSALNFIPGENLTVAVQILDPQRGIRYIPPAAAELTLTFTKRDSTDLVKTAAVIDADDRSMWKVTLSQAETTDLSGANVVVSLDVNGDASVIQKALIPNVLVRTNLSGDC